MFDKFFFTKFDNLPSLRFQKILIEILIKQFLNPSQAFFLKIKYWKNPAFFLTVIRGEEQKFIKIFKS